MELDDEFIKQLQQAFVEEGQEANSEIVKSLISLESHSDLVAQQPLLENILRNLHSLKGSSRAASAREIESLCQVYESAILQIKKQKRILLKSELDIFHISSDILADLLIALLNSSHAVDKQKQNKCIESLADLIDKNAVEQRASEVQNIQELDKVQKIENSSPKESLLDLAPTELLQKNNKTEIVEKEIKEQSFKSAETSSLKTAASIRVSESKLTEILEAAEELFLTKLAAEERVGELREADDLMRDWVRHWKKTYHELKKLTSIESKEFLKKESINERSIVEFMEWNAEHTRVFETQIRSWIRSAEQDYRLACTLVDNFTDSLKTLLMRDFGTVFGLFPKMVRDLGQQLGKDVTLQTYGSELEVDRRILEQLKDPLIHLVRNSLDHGIEKPDERESLSKPTKATLTVGVSQLSGNQMELLVQDDGRGINISKVKQAAIRERAITSEEAEKLSNDEAMDLIFRSSVSTSQMVTEISGRGLGMAIVREKVESLGGKIIIQSVEGEGTIFRILLPTSLSTLRGTLIRLKGQLFIVPTSNIMWCARVKLNEIKRVEGRDTVLYKTEVISTVDLSNLLGVNKGLDTRLDTFSRKVLNIVTIGHGSRKIGCIVDELVGEQDILLKPLGAPIVHVPNIAGATILASGRAVLVLNVSEVLDAASGTKLGSSILTQQQGDKAEKGKSRVLVVEDSLTTRMLMKNVLETAGYEVVLAKDGLEGLEKLRDNKVDLVVSDVEMPRMGGFDLTQKIRQNPQLARLPVLLLTSLASKEDRERGLTAGANAYFVKSSFDQENLLDIIERLI